MARRALLVEDDPHKEERLVEILTSVKPPWEITVGRTVQQAVELVRQTPYDLIVLDMALPSHEMRPGGAQPISEPSGGVEILLELSYDSRGDRVVIVTQYPEIAFDDRLYALSAFPKAIRKAMSVNLSHVIAFSMRGERWKGSFLEAVR